MNKPPQPITGPTSVPHPSPSPGLTQAAYAPGQPPSLVFASPPPQQMNSSPQPRQFAAGPRALHQQPYYTNRATMPTSAPRVQTSSGPRPVGPTHVYQPSSQMMMIPGQQLSFAGSPQGYFIPPGQYRAPYMPPSPQYPVTSGTAGFYPGTSPAEYPAYGAYYPAQPQYSHTPPVQTAPVMISPAQSQQQALPPQPPPSQPPAPKRERIAIRIRDPNQGGRDITEEIMSGGRATSTPPSQVSTWHMASLVSRLLCAWSPGISVETNISLPSKFSSNFWYKNIVFSHKKNVRKRLSPQILTACRGLKFILLSLTPPIVLSLLPTLSSIQEKEAAAAPEPLSTPAEPSPVAPPPLATADAPDETWEEKEDKQNADTPLLKPGDLKYQYKGEQWKPIDPEDKKRYDREFLLGFRYIGASMNKPEGLPLICDVVLDKANKTPVRPAEPGRNMMNAGPDFTPAFMGNLGRQSSGGGGGGPRGPGRDHMGIIISSSLGGDVELNKAEKAWKPAVKMGGSRGTGPEEEESDDPEQAKTQELFKRVRSILNKLTPQMFQQLMKQVTELTIDTEERLKGVIDLIFEKAISEPNFSVAYANMCRCLMGLKVPTTDKPGVTVNFRKLLLNRCQKEFEKDQDDDVIFEAKQKEMEAAKEEEKAGLKAELEEAKDKARRRSLGNIKFIGELFKLKMLTEAIMHDCIVKLLKNHDEESLECLCRLLSTIGKDLDFEKAKPRMDQYFAQMDKIIKEKKTSSRIRFMLQDVIDLRRSGWVPRRGEQGPKTIDQIHKDAEREEQMQLVKVQQQLMSRNDDRGGRDQGSRGGQGARGSQPQDEGWNTVPISTKNRPIDTSRLSKITKPGALDFSSQLLAPQLGGKGMWGSWGKGSSGGTTGAKPTGRPATGNRFSALQQSAPPASSSDADRRVPHRSSSSRDRGGDRDRFDRFERRDSSRDARPPVTKRSFSRETEERRSDSRTPTEPPVRRVASMSDDRNRGSRDRGVTCETDPTPPPAALVKPALTEEELDKKSNAIIEEYLHLNDMKEALQCVGELNSAPLLFVFVRNGLENTLERSAIARERMGLLLHQLLKAGTLPTTQYYKGLQEILEVAEDMAIDIPHIWQYLAELITPMLHDGGIPMGQLFREISKPLIPLGKAGLLLVQILNLLCKGMVSVSVHAALWGLCMSIKYVVCKIEFTLGEESDETNQKKPMSGEELSKHLDRLIQDKANNQRIRDWVEANLDEQQAAANQFVRALMTSICQSAVICENPYKVDVEQITQRAKLLQRYLSDEHRELQALYALQALMVHMEQPANLLRMFFDALYDEDVIKEEAFYKWESSKDPAEQTGKGVALKSVTAFFTWLREAEEESDKD
uniref:Eukaryotic translation initiation factor 4 gamma, 1a n=1 Tax=Hucho hucho TaxID=62062 RepID=A0A4W5QHZ6_9TELE